MVQDIRITAKAIVRFVDDDDEMHSKLESVYSCDDPCILEFNSLIKAALDKYRCTVQYATMSQAERWDAMQIFYDRYKEERR